MLEALLGVAWFGIGVLGAAISHVHFNRRLNAIYRRLKPHPSLSVGDLIACVVLGGPAGPIGALVFLCIDFADSPKGERFFGKAVIK